LNISGRTPQHVSAAGPVLPATFSPLFLLKKMTDNSEADILYSVNQTLQTSPNSSQRDFAKATNLSLGMTNALLKRFAEKGWIMMKKVSPRTIRYVLTSDGMNTLAERSRSYMSRTFRNIRECTESIERAVMESKQRGCTQVVLYGESDIAFIIEYACSKYGLKFSVEKQVPDKIISVPETMLLISERLDDESAQNLRNAGAHGVWEEK
jgi:DNA-binding MarR family transcriptional regulator